MKCPNCSLDVKDNGTYSQHMNKDHRGKSYTTLGEPKDSYRAKKKVKYDDDRATVADKVD